MNLPIRFNAQNVLKSTVGEHGLEAAELDKKAALDALIGFRARVDSGEVGFPNLPLDQNTAKSVDKYAADLRGDVESVLLLGIGGSALGPYALDSAIRGPHPVQLNGKKYPHLCVMDNV